MFRVWLNWETLGKYARATNVSGNMFPRLARPLDETLIWNWTLNTAHAQFCSLNTKTYYKLSSCFPSKARGTSATLLHLFRNVSFAKTNFSKLARLTIRTFELAPL